MHRRWIAACLYDHAFGQMCLCARGGTEDDCCDAIANFHGAGDAMDRRRHRRPYPSLHSLRVPQNGRKSLRRFLALPILPRRRMLSISGCSCLRERRARRSSREWPGGTSGSFPPTSLRYRALLTNTCALASEVRSIGRLCGRACSSYRTRCRRTLRAARKTAGHSGTLRTAVGQDRLAAICARSSFCIGMGRSRARAHYLASRWTMPSNC